MLRLEIYQTNRRVFAQVLYYQTPASMRQDTGNVASATTVVGAIQTLRDHMFREQRGLTGISGTKLSEMGRAFAAEAAEFIALLNGLLAGQPIPPDNSGNGGS